MLCETDASSRTVFYTSSLLTLYNLYSALLDVQALNIGYVRMQ